MLERSSACLQRGALHRLAKASTFPHSTRRMPHCGFWVHGAGQLDLALSALSEVVGLERSQSTSRHRTQAEETIGLAGTFLDFLYPSKTLATVRSYSTIQLSLPSRSKGKTSRKSRRTFSSLVTDTSNPSSDSKQHLYLTKPKKSTTTSTVPSHSPTVSHSPPAKASHQIKGAEAELEHAWEVHTQRSKLSAKDLKRIVNVLGKSHRQIDSERLIQVYNGIPRLSRTSVEYQAAAFAYIKLEDFTNALSILREALPARDAYALASNITAKALELRRWDLAFEAWSIGQNSESKHRHYLQWEETQYSEVLCERAHLLSTASPVALTTYWTSTPEKLRSQWQDFQRAVACSALQFGSPSTSSKLVLDLFEQLKQWRVHSSDLYSTWIRHFYGAGDNLNALRLYMRARTAKFIPGVKNFVFKVPFELLQSLTQTATRLDNLRAAQFIHDDFFHFYNGPNLGASQMVLKVFAKHGKLENVKSLIDHIFHTNGPPKDCRTLTSLLHVHAQRRELAETRAAFESISAKYGLQPNLACYNILIRAYAREDDAESAMELFNQLGPNASTTSLDLAQRSVRLKPDFYTYGTLMGLFSQRGDTARVDDLYRMVREDGIHITTPMIDCLVLARIRSGRLSDALRIVNEATAEDSNQSLTTMWNYIILGHVFNQDLQGMKDTYDRMQQADIKFNAMTYAAFLQGLVFARRFDHAIRVLWKIMPMAGIQPSAFHHGILMIGLVNANKNAFALFVYEKMIDRRIAPNETTQVQMLKAAANLEMHQADSDDIPNDIPEYSIAQEFLTEGANGRRKPTLSSYPEPQQSKISPGSRLAYLEQLMNRHAALGQGNRVKELQKKWIQEMQRLYPDRHPLLSFNIIWALMRSHVKSDNFEEGDKYWEQLVAHVRKEAAASGIDVQTSGWVQAPQRTRLCVPLSYQMRSLARRNKLEKLVQLIRDLRQDGFTLNNLNTNIYAEILSQSQSPRLIQLAFEACEEHLMSLWSGWKSLKTVAVMTFNKSKLVDKDFRPHYRTMVSLSTALLDLKQLSRDGRDGKGALQHVEENCPRTLQAIQSLPRVEDSTQMGSFLRNSGDA